MADQRGKADDWRPDADAIEARLRARRAELEALATAHEEDRKPVALDQTRVGRLSRMEALQGQAMALEVERRREVELARVDTALERLAAGEYGECVNCGEPIEPRRLELDPSTPVCLACASRSSK
ncbi:MAG: TraR/DksA C4-type zinc finger protein [Pseudomonadota bacterium]